VKLIESEDRKRALRGAIHLLTRIFPIVLEDRDQLIMKLFWKEDPHFRQINALLLMEAISLLLFKPGFTIAPLDDPAAEIQFYCIVFCLF